MPDSNLNGFRVAIICTDLFEQAEMTEPRKALDEAGAKTVLIAPKKGNRFFPRDGKTKAGFQSGVVGRDIRSPGAIAFLECFINVRAKPPSR